jgi:RND family efflux transporter MFP subunit
MADQLSADLAALRIQRGPGGPASPWPKRLLWLGLLGGAGWAAWTFGKPALESRVFKPEVELTQIVVVSPAESQAKVTSSGYVVPQRVTKVGAKTVGRIKSMKVIEGQEVEAGQVLAELEGADLHAQLNSAKARVLTARAQVQTAKAELADALQKAKRERKLASAGIGTAAAGVRAAEAEVENFEVQIGYLTVTAPMTGTVVAKPAQEGELVGVMASSLVELADFTSLMVETDVPEGRLHLLKIGDPAEIVLDAFPTERHRGRVAGVSPRVNRAKATVTVKVAFIDPSKGALPDMAARVSFLEAELDDEARKEPARVIVPANAITERDGNKVVFVVEDGALRMSAVVLGDEFGNGFELVSGPPAGAQVVREPSRELQDGQKVKQKGEAT